MNRRLLFLMLFAFFAFVAWTQAQSVTVSGTVVGKDDGQPVIGANIVIKGTTTGTVSDVDGHFRLTAPRPGATLVISFVGYRTKELPATASMHVELEPDVTQLGEVQVVVAYGQQKKSSLTGAATNVKASSLAAANDERLERRRARSFCNRHSRIHDYLQRRQDFRRHSQNGYRNFPRAR